MAARPGERVMTVADTTAPSKYDNNPWPSAVARIKTAYVCGRPPDLTSMILDVKLLFPSK